MFDALRVAGGRVLLSVYQGLKHDCWTRAYLDPELPRWLLAHRKEGRSGTAEQPFAERQVIPLHPPAIKLPTSALDALAGEYHDLNGHLAATFYRQGESLFEKSPQGDVFELAPESPSVFFYPNGSSLSRLTFEHDSQGRILGAIFHDDRHDEHWDKRAPASAR